MAYSYVSLTFGIFVSLASVTMTIANDTPPTTRPVAETRRELGIVLVNAIDYDDERRESIVRALLLKGADPNVRVGDHRRTAIDRVKELEDSPARKELMRMLTNPPRINGGKDAMDQKAITDALNWAVFNVIEFPPDDAAVLIEDLLAVGADPRAEHPVLLLALADNCGNTWHVSHNDWRRAADALIKAGAKVDDTPDGLPSALASAVDIAARNAEYDHNGPEEFGMIEYLIAKGADPKLRDGKGKSALDRAAEIKNEPVRKKVLGMLKKK